MVATVHRGHLLGQPAARVLGETLVEPNEGFVVNLGGGSAEADLGGVQMNFIPKDGGNVYSGTVFVNGTWGALQSDNFSERLKNAGLRSGNKVRKAFDINPGIGGPLRRNKVWFYAGARVARNSNWAAGEFRDKNFNNPNAWLYEPDLSQPVSNNSEIQSGRLRLTWQASQRARSFFR